MRKGEAMRPVVFKGGKAWGKVEGIRGLFREPNGRWFVRKSIKGIDKQKTLTFESESPCFSVLEREAAKALRQLEKEITATLGEATESAPRDTRTALQRGQDACRAWVEKTYTREHFSRDTVSRRKREADGFAFVTRALLDHADELNEHNAELANRKFTGYVERGSEVASVDCIRIIKAIFAKATEQGKHFGSNPASLLCDIHRKRKDKPDERFVSMEQSAMVLACIPRWCKEHGVPDEMATELELFFYLLTLGMRPSSAILFNADDLTLADGVYRYRVNNAKCGVYMPVSQVIHPAFGKRLKAMPVYDRGKYKTSFSKSEKGLCERLNEILSELLDDQSCKSMRKGFVTETMAQARVSKTFDTVDARRITHIISDTADKNYNCDKQTGCDRVMEWWNGAWFKLYDYYKNLPENKLTKRADKGDTLTRRAAFENLEDILGDDE